MTIQVGMSIADRKSGSLSRRVPVMISPQRILSCSRPRYRRTAAVPRQATTRMARTAITAAVTALLWLPLLAIRATRPVIPAPIPALAAGR